MLAFYISVDTPLSSIAFGSKAIQVCRISMLKADRPPFCWLDLVQGYLNAQAWPGALPFPSIAFGADAIQVRRISMLKADRPPFCQLDLVRGYPNSENINVRSWPGALPFPSIAFGGEAIQVCRISMLKADHPPFCQLDLVWGYPSSENIDAQT